MKLTCQIVAEQVGMLFTCSEVNQFIRIRTPFLYPDGDIIDVFLKENGDHLVLSDLGETLRWLRMQTISARRTKKQNALIDDVCLNHNVEQLKGMILVRVQQPSDLGVMLMRLCQALLGVSDIWFTFRNQAFESIVDEVEAYLLEKGVSYGRNVKVLGRSTRSWNVDFHILQSTTYYISVLSTMNSSVANKLTDTILAQWIDLSNVRVASNARFISVFDDTSEAWREHNFRQLEEYSEIVYWSRPERLLEQIAG